METAQSTVALQRWAAISAFGYAALSLWTCFVMPSEPAPLLDVSAAELRQFLGAHQGSLIFTALLSGLQFAPLLLHTESLSLLLERHARPLLTNGLRWAGRVAALIVTLAAALSVSTVEARDALSDGTLVGLNFVEVLLWAALLVPFGLTALCTALAGRQLLWRGTILTGGMLGCLAAGGAPWILGESGVGLAVGLAIFLHPFWATLLGLNVLSQQALAAAALPAIDAALPAAPVGIQPIPGAAIDGLIEMEGETLDEQLRVSSTPKQS